MGLPPWRRACCCSHIHSEVPWRQCRPLGSSDFGKQGKEIPVDKSGRYASGWRSRPLDLVGLLSHVSGFSTGSSLTTPIHVSGLLNLLNERSPTAFQAIFPLIAGVGLGILFHAPYQVFTRALPPHEIATGTSAFFLVRFTGATVGLVSPATRTCLTVVESTNSTLTGI
jgi:hypothetical protein